MGGHSGGKSNVNKDREDQKEYPRVRTGQPEKSGERAGMEADHGPTEAWEFSL